MGSRFDPSVLRAIRERIPLSEIVGRDIRLIRCGREFQGLCPFHAERTPSFTVCEDKGFAHCFGCGWNGDVFGYLMARGRTFVEAVTELADLAGVAVSGQRPSRPLRPVLTRRNQEDRAAKDAAAAERARILWAGSDNARGTVVERYLREGRGLDLDRIGGLPDALRFRPCDECVECGADGRFRVVWAGPVMIAPLVLPDGDGKARIVGVHRTWLCPDGSSRLKEVDGLPVRGKKMLGRASGSIIPLSSKRMPHMQGGEGIETSLAGWCAVPSLPAIALASLGNFSGRTDGHGGWTPWAGLKTFTWLEDADGTNPADMEQRVTRGLARLHRSGVQVRRASPPVGMDMNDFYRKGT
ncbi:hypothetical protein HEQ62_10155 [Haematospirillum jordaniae]|uniref:Zinc finger CHC2-type domain-containing protein n=1 Tax=Haematospirillum jordaniae TaxID=1549855 RepID=A0A143DCN6_9PROT|nr:CHC2 zinc finger domain-containing protein [Haematospirillum jordaniae]AMW34300.1 hypothetical protein AY555_02865 [Haematospirillum jordaniae]NKD60132.1 hypothetical protein [Haematospirillum jordaniae]NKD68103.1 hypothetical protein [Haematospirillum jordaniae]NKD82305.1 hypothetical protein [Haematospirillum jordaniae]NKD86083.1 hypothetical protein [Haematospirillum jordaniae]